MNNRVMKQFENISAKKETIKNIFMGKKKIFAF